MLDLLIDWLITPAEINRVVNVLYLIIVSCIALGVLITAIVTKNKNGIRIYLFSIPVWLFIEGFGLVTGLREYDINGPMFWITYIVVAVGEDPGWVALAYMVSEWSLKFLANKYPNIILFGKG